MPYKTNAKRRANDDQAIQKTEKYKKERAQRNAARREMEKEGKVKKGDGKDVAHKKAVSKGGTNAKSNLTVQPKSKNRSFKRKSDGSMK